MKGWIVSTENSEGSAIVFANTRNEEKLEALYTDKSSDERYIDLRAHRVPEIDGMENCEPKDNYWLNHEIRMILVKEYDWSCVEPVLEDCDSCVAKNYCHYFD